MIATMSRATPRLALAVVLLGLGCSAAPSPTGSEAAASSPAPGTLPDRDSALAHRLVEQEGAILLDVRSPEEFADGHIEGAINIPHTEVEGRMAEIVAQTGEDGSRPIVVYCRSGRRSGLAKEVLVQHGLLRVTNLGGMTAW